MDATRRAELREGLRDAIHEMLDVGDLVRAGEPDEAHAIPVAPAGDVQTDAFEDRPDGVERLQPLPEELEIGLRTADVGDHQVHGPGNEIRDVASRPEAHERGVGPG